MGIAGILNCSLCAASYFCMKAFTRTVACIVVNSSSLSLPFFFFRTGMII